MFDNTYKNKTVILTGHTGFKGSWLTMWLLKMGANVIGISKDIPTRPSMFKILKIKKNITHYSTDIRDFKKLQKIIFKHKPDFIFHLAAQSIVSKSYVDPEETVTTNVVGTMNILEALRFYKKNCAAIIITSDKCYENLELKRGYLEKDNLGGERCL